MNNHAIPAVAAILTALLLPLVCLAAETREITWDDLIPAEAEFDDPFTKLDEDTLFELSMVMGVRYAIESGREVDEERLARNEKREQALKDKGVDVDGLIAMVDEVEAARAAKLQLTNEELNGTDIRMPGYLLPLEFDGDKVTEFFLVPYVGACIHVPPPPPNQIVHVKLSEGYSNEGGLFTPVWVEGTIENKRMNSNLSLVDGAAFVPSSYAIAARLVEPYK